MPTYLPTDLTVGVTTALLDGTRCVDVIQAHRGLSAAGPAVVTVTSPISLSADDVVTLLYLISDNLTAEDLADDDYLRRLVAEQAVNASLQVLADTRYDVVTLPPGSPAADWVAYLRQRVEHVFGTHTTTAGTATDTAAGARAGTRCVPPDPRDGSSPAHASRGPRVDTSIPAARDVSRQARADASPTSQVSRPPADTTPHPTGHPAPDSGRPAWLAGCVADLSGIGQGGGE